MGNVLGICGEQPLSSGVFPRSLTLVTELTDFQPFELGNKETRKCRRFFIRQSDELPLGTFWVGFVSILFQTLHGWTQNCAKE